jgi:hypothetical protein
MSTTGAADEWDFTVPADAAQLQAELRRHGAEPGRRVRVVLVDDGPLRKRKSVRGVLAGKLPDDFLTDEDFEVQHQANVEAAERRFGPLDR